MKYPATPVQSAIKVNHNKMKYMELQRWMELSGADISNIKLKFPINKNDHDRRLISKKNFKKGEIIMTVPEDLFMTLENA